MMPGPLTYQVFRETGLRTARSREERTIWTASSHRSIITGLLGSFNGAGFVNGLLKRVKASRLVYISWLNKISSQGQIRSACMGPLALEIASVKKKLFYVQKKLLCLLELNFEKILHNTEYVSRCLKTVWNF